MRSIFDDAHFIFFAMFSPADQKKVRHAIATRRIAPNDMTHNPVPNVPGPSQGVKRKADELTNGTPNTGVVTSRDKGGSGILVCHTPVDGIFCYRKAKSRFCCP